MAKITENKKITVSAAEADAIIRNADGRVCFGFSVTAFLPTGDGKGFEGMTTVKVSKAEARRLVRNLLSPTLEGRGAKITLDMHAPDPNYRNASAWIFIH